MNNHLLKHALTDLPSIESLNSFRQACPCKVCAGRALPFDLVDFWKFCSEDNCYEMGLSGVPVTYVRCIRCGFIFTTFFDDWTTEDFSRLVYNDDYGLIDGEYKEIRPARDAAGMARRLSGIARTTRLLDFGSGSGTFSDKLRELSGLEFANYDPFSHPTEPDGQFDLLTCFEVMEHSPDPQSLMQALRRFAAPGASVLFSTGLQPANIELLRGNWWYIGPRNGHASIYNAIALAILAEQVGFGFCSGKNGVYALKGLPPSALSADIAAEFEEPLFVRYLVAPSASSGTLRTGWHGTEQSTLGAFRWSAEPRLVWQIPSLPPDYPCRLRIEIPFLMEAVPGYAKQCRILVNGRDLKAWAGRWSIGCDLVLADEEPLEVVLEGPNLPPGPQFGDQRRLGLAIPLS